MIRNGFLISLCVLLLAGCGRDDDRTAADVPDVDDAIVASLFDRIDADSIYVAANFEPLPASLSDKMWAAMHPIAEQNAWLYRTMSEDMDVPLAAAMLRELAAIDSREAFEARGLHGNGLWAVHGISMYPVLHWQLIDAAAFSATLERIAAEAETDLPMRGIGDEQLIWIDLGDFGLAIHHDDAFVTLALVPDDMALLRRIANLDQPADKFRQRQLRDLNRQRGYLAQGSGYLDFGLLVERLLDADDELADAARRTAEFQDFAANPACQAELRALASIFPRISSGYTRATGSEMEMSFALEIDSEIGEKLARIASAPLSLDSGRAGMFSAGLALNLVAARDFGREVVGGWAANPPQCPLFSNIADNAEQWQINLNQPIPPVVTNIHGFRINIDRMDIGGIGNGMPDIGQAAGTLAVFMRNPQMLVGMAQMFSPDMAALDLRSGADPQPVPSGLIPNLPDQPAWIALGDSAIGLAFGEDQKDKLKDALRAGDADTMLLRYGIDGAAYADMMGNIMEQAYADIQALDEDFEPPPQNILGGAIAEIYEYFEFSLHLKPDGIEMNSRMWLKE